MSEKDENFEAQVKALKDIIEGNEKLQEIGEKRHKIEIKEAKKKARRTGMLLGGGGMLLLCLLII